MKNRTVPVVTKTIRKHCNCQLICYNRSFANSKRDGPMKEKDWDYVFQANKILHCSLVNPGTSRIERASHAGEFHAMDFLNV